jgi:NADH-quinone oxidoreductase subunit J
VPLDNVVFWVFAPMLDAPFLFAVQIIVYAGAIMVLFLFVIMLLGVEGDAGGRERLLGQRALAVTLAAAFILELFVALRAGIGFGSLAPSGFDTINEPGNTQALAAVLFRDYFFPFEVTSILLIVAAIAAMVLAQRRTSAVTQAEIDAAAKDRLASADQRDEAEVAR